MALKFNEAAPLVLSGCGTFTIIPRGPPYDYWSPMPLLLVHSPANIDEADINLEEPPFDL